MPLTHNILKPRKLSKTFGVLICLMPRFFNKRINRLVIIYALFLAAKRFISCRKSSYFLSQIVLFFVANRAN